ncbi:hypothetical protein KDK_37920 [Dictyobacter kobayashii]|uniref:Uncharacterized protein n=1 Tax=Dictyobacter kobayashii TaxID=2014872 RepID=A0A402ALI5_9CHLR|nr:hypothetical protein KDK_37920 [Dictyobacter kobayashii]
MYAGGPIGDGTFLPLDGSAVDVSTVDVPAGSYSITALADVQLYSGQIIICQINPTTALDGRLANEGTTAGSVEDAPLVVIATLTTAVPTTIHYACQGFNAPSVTQQVIVIRAAINAVQVSSVLP